MTQHTSKTIAVLAALLAATMLAGCLGGKATPNPQEGVSPLPATSSVDATTSTEPTASQEETVAVDTPTITTPKEGSAERKALLDAAREFLGTSSSFEVGQLKVLSYGAASSKPSYALGDLRKSSDGKRYFIAWQGPSWKGVWKAEAGKASADALLEAAPDFPEELTDKVDFKKTWTVSETTLKSSLTASAKTWAKSLMNGKGQPYTVTSVKVKKDSKGNWWGTVVVAPTGSYEDLWFWCSYGKGVWKGEPVSGGDERQPSDYFPSDVIDALGPF